MIDSHCHLDLDVFDEDREAVIAECEQLGIDRLLLPGLTLKQFAKLRSLKHQNAHLDIALGLHPHFLTVLEQNPLDKLLCEFSDLARQYQDTIVAIGECGLDAKINTPMPYQEVILTEHIKLATKLKLPLIIHHRQTHHLLIRLLKQQRFLNGGIIHAFSGSQEIAHTYIDLGFCLGVGGIITYPRANKTRNTLKHTSLNDLVLETDAPDMPIMGYQGKRNSPSRLPLIAQALAELKGISVTEVIQQTDNNYYRLFS